MKKSSIQYIATLLFASISVVVLTATISRYPGIIEINLGSDGGKVMIDGGGASKSN
jgi:hypothetical protein